MEEEAFGGMGSFQIPGGVTSGGARSGDSE